VGSGSLTPRFVSTLFVSGLLAGCLFSGSLSRVIATVSSGRLCLMDDRHFKLSLGMSRCVALSVNLVTESSNRKIAHLTLRFLRDLRMLPLKSLMGERADCYL
jgi:hypothetical protein